MFASRRSSKDSVPSAEDIHPSHQIPTTLYAALRFKVDKLEAKKSEIRLFRKLPYLCVRIPPVLDSFRSRSDLASPRWFTQPTARRTRPALPFPCRPVLPDSYIGRNVHELPRNTIGLSSGKPVSRV